MTKSKKVLPIPQIIYRPLKSLTELEGNPRKIDKKQMDILVKSISENTEYFEARPLILSNRTKKLVILAGNMRFKASIVLKLIDCPTILLEGLTEAKEKEIIIRDNAQSGEWDWELLNSEWDVVKLADWGLEEVKGKEVSFTPKLTSQKEFSEGRTTHTCPNCNTEFDD